MFGDPVTNPMGWEVTTLGKELDFLTSGSRGWAKYYTEKGDIFIRIQNLKNGFLELDDVAFVDAPDSAESKRTKVEPEDVLLSITADLGRTAVVPHNIGKAHISQHLAILRLKEMNSVFVSQFLESPGGQRQFGLLNRSAVKAGLNFDDIRKVSLIKPPSLTQQRFEKIYNVVQKEKTIISASERQAETLFSALQQQAFQGEL